MLKDYVVPILVSVCFLVLGILTLSDYGISWDGQFRMLRGQANAKFLLEGKQRYDFPAEPKVISPVIFSQLQKISRYHFSAWEVDLTEPKIPSRPLPLANYIQREQNLGIKTSFYQHEDWDGDYFLHSEGFTHPPIIDALAALSNIIFFQKLGFLGDIESYQLFYLFASAIGVFVVSIFTFQITKSFWAAAAAGISLALFPIFFQEAHINMKDPIQASFYAGTVWGFWNFVRLNSKRWFVVFAIFSLLALGVKWNIVFLPFIILPWLFLIRRSDQFRKWFRYKSLLKLGISAVIAGVVLTIIIAPYLPNLISAFFGVLEFYYRQGIGANSTQPEGFYGPLGFNFYPLVLFLFQTPEIILLLFGSGLYFGFSKLKGDPLKTVFLLSLWFIEPLLRYSFPDVRTLLGLRQIMEIYPVIAIISGIGFYAFIQFLKTKKIKVEYQKAIVIGSFVLILITLSIPIIKYHPQQNTYYNNLVGGLFGAVENKMVDYTLTYGSAYKQAAEWINNNSEKDANIALVSGTDFALSPLFLRPDISISPSYFSGFEQKGEYLLFLLDPDDPNIFVARFASRFLKPVHQVLANGVPILTIYKNSPENLINPSVKEILVQNFKAEPISLGNFLLNISLPKPKKVTRIVVSTKSDLNCIKHNPSDVFTFQSPNEILTQGINDKKTYPFNEIKILDSGEIEYLFPAEETSNVLILPAGENSCFKKAEIKQIFALED